MYSWSLYNDGGTTSMMGVLDDPGVCELRVRFLLSDNFVVNL